MSEETLDSLLNDDEETETSEEDTTETEETEEQSTDDTEKESADSEDSTESTGDNEGEPPSQDKDDQEELTEREQAWYNKAQDEKRKRQDLEKQLEQRQEGKQEKQEEEIPDPIEDPKGYAKYLEAKSARDQFATRVSISQDLMREKHSDYDDKEAAFMQLAKTDPSLINQLQQAPNPAKFAYQTAVKAERVAQFDNYDEAVKTEVDKQVAEKEKEIRAKLEKEYEAKLKKAQSIPPSGADAGSKGSDDTTAGSESLSDILGED